ncbi:hypothetical protein IJG01_03010 [Candidatus Saccharibacteria bacterium]|nr:hypothetical protein [Candidatus Saccharibacteria bacterium]
MNFRDLIRSIWQNNKAAIIGLGILTIGLIISNIIAVSIKNYEEAEPDDGEYVAGDTFYNEKEAVESSEDINIYKEELHNIIKSHYGEMLNGYEIMIGKLLESDGLWYVTTIKQPLKDRWSLATDTFRLILQQDNNSWKIVTEPSLYFEYSKYPNIPKDVIISANNM